MCKDTQCAMYSISSTLTGCGHDVYYSHLTQHKNKRKTGCFGRYSPPSRTDPPRDYFTKIDLTDTYLTLPLRKEDRKFVEIKLGEVIYQFRTLAFGVSSAPWIFTKMLKPVITCLRRQGVRLIIYLDDILLLNSCKVGARKIFLLIREKLENCDKKKSYADY